MRKNKAGSRAGYQIQNKDSEMFAKYLFIAFVSCETRSIWENINCNGTPELIEAACIYAATQNDIKGKQLSGEAGQLWPQMRCAVDKIMATQLSPQMRCAVDKIIAGQLWPQIRCAIDEMIAGRARI